MKDLPTPFIAVTVFVLLFVAERFFPLRKTTLSIGFSLLQVTLIGPSAWAFAVYQLLFQAEVLFQHSNVRLPIGAERLLNKVLVWLRPDGTQVERQILPGERNRARLAE